MHKHKGVALIIVLLIVALVSIVATEMGSRLQLQVQKASNIKDSNQAYWYAMGAEAFARKALHEQLQESNGVINLDQPWAQQEFTFPLPNGGIEAELADGQSCFNLNALYKDSGNTAPLTKGILKQMLLSLEDTEIPDYNADLLEDGVIDWLDKDSDISTYGAEDSDYESMAHPYLAANGLMASASELRLINGAEAQWLPQVLKHVCVLPADSQLTVNVNTLTEDDAPLLKAMLGNNTSIKDARSVIANRRPEGFDNIEDFFAVREVNAAQLNSDQKKWFDITSHYFILHTNSRYNNASFRMSSLFKVGTDNQLQVVRRQFGGIH